LAGIKPAQPELRTYTVHYDTLQVNINERGQVESVNNNDLICRIKAKTPNSTISTSIKWVIDDGSLVEKGEKLMELDASALEDQRKNHLIAADEARSALVKAQGDYDSALIGRRIKIADAKRAVELARIDLKVYSEGDYQQKLKEFENRMQETRTIVDMWEDRAHWSERVARRGYLTPSQARTDELHHQSAQHALDRQAEQRHVLDLEKEYTEMSKKGLITDAKDNQDKAVIEADTDVESKKATLDAARTRYALARSRLADVEEQIGFCTITAPHSGMVVHYRDENARWGVGKQNRISLGERVSEGQKLLRIPDMKNMQVITEVPETLVANLRGDVEGHTGFTQTAWAVSLLAGRDAQTILATHQFFHAAQEDFLQQHRCQEFKLLSRGQPARVRIDGFPDQELRGHVHWVSPVPSQQEFLPVDIKLYPVMIAIDEPLEGLRLGMSAQVTIPTDHRAERVLTVPLQAIVGSFRMGSIRRCYVVTPHGPEQRDVVVGLTNDKVAEVKSGLQEGDVVVLNPVVLLDGAEKTESGAGKQGGGFKKGGADRPVAPSSGERVASSSIH
jgi:HlyD family secretion protein